MEGDRGRHDMPLAGRDVGDPLIVPLGWILSSSP
jgi:hypothetical protein